MKCKRCNGTGKIKKEYQGGGGSYERDMFGFDTSNYKDCPDCKRNFRRKRNEDKISDIIGNIINNLITDKWYNITFAVKKDEYNNQYIDTLIVTSVKKTLPIKKGE